MSFANYKSRRKNTSAEKLADEVAKLDPSSRKRVEDTRFWRPQTDKAGNGYAVIRFLPSKEEDDLVVPFVSVYDHGFQGPSGKWYIENSLTSIGKEDPVSELNQKLWNSGREEDKDTVRRQKRRLHYLTNIYVVKDPAQPQNEGQVFLYRIGTKIYNKIKEAMNPPVEFEEKPIVPYDFWEGANFKLKIRKVEGYLNYDNSSFDEQSSLLDGEDDEIEKVYEKIQSLKQFINPEGKDVNGYALFKPYAELKKKLYNVLDMRMTDVSSDEDEAPAKPKPEPKKEEKKLAADAPFDTSTSTSDDGDSTLDYFKGLLKED